MPCLLLFVILLFPRVAVVLIWLFSTYLQRAFHGGLLLPVLGFIFLPLATIVYAWELNSGIAKWWYSHTRASHLGLRE